jgi:hypothetical protein
MEEENNDINEISISFSERAPKVCVKTYSWADFSISKNPEVTYAYEE